MFNPKINIAFFLRNLRRSAAFTLVEMLVVIAILGILAAVALPAYNNYSLKSKFAENVLATAPTKTAISTCAVSGECVSGGAISIAMAASAVAATPATITADMLANPGQQAFYNVVYAVYTANGKDPATAASLAANVAPIVASRGYYLSNDPSVNTAPGNLAICSSAGNCDYYVNTPNGIESLSASPSIVFPALGMPAVAATAGLNLPCVGNSASGCSPSTKYVATVSYDATGIITATAQTASGLNAETFVLVPALSGGRVDWAASGSCQTRAGGALC